MSIRNTELQMISKRLINVHVNWCDLRLIWIARNLQRSYSFVWTPFWSKQNHRITDCNCWLNNITERCYDQTSTKRHDQQCQTFNQPYMIRPLLAAIIVCYTRHQVDEDNFDAILYRKVKVRPRIGRRQFQTGSSTLFCGRSLPVTTNSMTLRPLTSNVCLLAGAWTIRGYYAVAVDR
jgi:hypothetical protein